MLVLSLVSCLIAVSISVDNIRVTVDNAAQDYYFRVAFSNINAASCGTSISSVKLLVNGGWVSSSQTYDGTDYAWDYNGIKFGDMIPISLQITTGTSTITMDGIVESLNGDTTYTADQTICSGETASPTTPRPIPSPTAPTTPYPTGESVCSNKASINWQSYNNQIYFNGNRFNMKGLSWFGFETPNSGLYGLDRHSMDWYFDWMVERGFNAIRMPFASDYINAGTSNLNSYVNAVKAAGDKGLLVMLDMHSKTVGSWTDGLNTIDQDDEVATWRKVAAAMVSNDVWNVLFVDVFNEPHDVSNSQWEAWVQFCERVGEAVWDEGLNALIAIEGTNSDCSVYSCCWGENVEGVRSTGKTFEGSIDNKFVWSPHVYTGDVTGNWVYGDNGFYAHWGYLADNHATNEAALVIGEFGTRNELTWLGDLVDYLLGIDQKNHFFWCLNPNSGDTGGLLQSDWTTEESDKLAILDTLQPNPSAITVSSSRICISGLGDSDAAPNPVSQPVSPPVSPPVSQPASSPVASPVASGSGIRIKNNGGNGAWWVAVEFPDGNINSVSKLELRDGNHGSWMTGTKESWGAYSFANHGGQQFSGSQSYRITTDGGRKANWNVFANQYDTSTATLNIRSAFTEEDTVGDSSLTWPALVAIIICSLLCILCIGCGVWYYKKKQINKGEASFQSTAADTPEPSKGDDSHDTPRATNEDEAEIEVEMNMDHVTSTQQ